MKFSISSLPVNETANKHDKELEQIETQTNVATMGCTSATKSTDNITNTVLDSKKSKISSPSTKFTVMFITISVVYLLSYIPTSVMMGSGSIRPILLKVRNTEVKSRIMRKRADFKKAKKGYKLSDDVTKDNADLITNLLKQDHVEQAWFFNCNVYAKLKDTDGKKEVPRVMFDINDNIEKKIKKRLKPRDESDPHSGYATDSESESE